MLCPFLVQGTLLSNATPNSGETVYDMFNVTAVLSVELKWHDRAYA